MHGKDFQWIANAVFIGYTVAEPIPVLGITILLEWIKSRQEAVHSFPGVSDARNVEAMLGPMIIPNEAVVTF